jgi:pimeloyl-ACP methyl ester carboxylesterase
MTTIPRRVRSTDGISLAVYETGGAGRPTLVLVHGYPDNHAMWDGLAALLADRFHVVTYDVRGAGASDQPAARSAYRISQLVADLAVVLDAVSPDAAVHVLGHDWGSVQCWAAVTDYRLAGRIASYTSISGPSLDYTAAWLRRAHRHPWAALRQLAHSYYIALFHLPRLPETAIRAGVLDRLIRRANRHVHGTNAVHREPPRSEADKINGLELYRANMLASARHARPMRTDVPTQVIAPERDPFITKTLAFEAPRPWVGNLTTRVVAGGHWVANERPDVVSRLVTDFIESSSEAGRPVMPRRPSPARSTRRRDGSTAAADAERSGGTR